MLANRVRMGVYSANDGIILNISYNKETDTSSTYNASYTGDKAVDGDISSTRSRWLSSDPSPSITVLLGGNYPIHGLGVYTQLVDKAISAELYNNDLGWVDIGNLNPKLATSEQSDFSHILLDDIITANKVKFNFSDTGVVRIYEVMVMGKATNNKVELSEVYENINIRNPMNATSSTTLNNNYSSYYAVNNSSKYWISDDTANQWIIAHYMVDNISDKIEIRGLDGADNITVSVYDGHKWAMIADRRGIATSRIDVDIEPQLVRKIKVEFHGENTKVYSRVQNISLYGNVYKEVIK